MTAKKPFHLIPAFLIVASALTIVGCSKSDTSDTTLEENTSSLVDDVTDQTDQIAHDATAVISEETDAATDAVADAEQAGSEAIESATSAAKEAAETTAEKTASLTASAKAGVSDAADKVAKTSSNAAKAVTEKAADAKTAVTSKVEALTAESGGSQEEMLALAKKNGCLACHSIEKKIVGPAWRDVAAKYRDTSDAKTNIIHSITNGSTGKWGTFAMPANSPRVSDKDIATLAGFVLSLK